MIANVHAKILTIIFTALISTLALLFTLTYHLHSTVLANSTTFNVVAGDDTLEDRPGECTLSKALQNINDQTQTNEDCPTPGSNNTIQLPEGTVTLTEDSYFDNEFNLQIGEDITIGADVSFSIEGQSVNSSTISGNGDYMLIGLGGNSDVRFSNFSYIEPGAGAIGAMNVARTTLNNIIIDGNSSCVNYGVVISKEESASIEISIDDVFIHNFWCDNENFGPSFGIVIDSSRNAELDIDISDTGVSNIYNTTTATGIAFGIGMIGGASGEDARATISSNFNNIVVDDISSDNISGGISGQPANQSSVDIEANLNYKNIIIKNIKSVAGGMQPPGFPDFLQSGSIGLRAGAFGSGATTVNESYQNVVVLDSIHDNENRACVKQNIMDSATINITSLGGNFSDDDTCSDEFFTHSTDQNNVTNLASTLNPLSLNGGTIPSIAPKPGSPVIDAGICEGAPTTDIRGISRPQGLSCDSGAVEVIQTNLTKPSTGITSPKNNKRIFMDPIAPGVVMSQSDILDSTQLSQPDPGYEYPFGLLAFTAEGVEPGSTHEVNLYFETDEPADQFVARKHNPNADEYFTIEEATLTNEDKDGIPVVKLSYPITDGGDLDIDGQADGTLTDPVGLAQ